MTITRPTDSPLFATDTTLSGGPQVGLSTRLSPGAGALAQGFWQGRKLPGRAFSYLVGTLGDWVRYLDLRQQSLQAQNWPERASFGSVAAANSNFGIAFSPSFGPSGRPLYCLLDAAKTLYTSVDGISGWLAIATLTDGTTSRPNIALGQLDGVPAFMTNGGVGGHFYTSIDGVNWTLKTTGPSTTNTCVAYAPSLNRWVSIHGTGADYCTGTTAGIAAWSSAGSIGFSGGARRVVWNGSLFVAIPASSSGLCSTSPDGLIWTPRTMPVTGVWSGLAYSDYDGMWMAGNTTTGPMVTSVDGITWTTAASAGMYLGNDLANLGPLWVMPTALGNVGGIVYSIDRGESWNSVAVGNHGTATDGWKRILAGDNRLIVGHADGTNIDVALSLRAS